MSRVGATELKSFKATVASFLSNTFLLGGSVALSIHVVLTFFRMHGLALTLAFVAFWLICVTAYFRWQGKQSMPRRSAKIQRRTSTAESPLRLGENDNRPEARHTVVQTVQCCI